MRGILMIAFHFPPQAGSSGLLRSLKFCCYLPEFGWLPTVLTAHPRAYERLDTSQAREIPPSVRVVRAFALDTQRHLSWRGRYFQWSALPDRWAGWCLGGVLSGLRTIRRNQIQVIWSTFPIATALLIGFLLHRLTGKPWIVDFRDSMTEDNYPRNRLTRRTYRWIERQAVERAAKLIFTARSTIEMYRNRYPQLRSENCLLISNGYDEHDFENLPSILADRRSQDQRVRLVHMGLLYPEERDPKPFFQALARLKREGRLSKLDLCIELRASGFDELYSPMLRDLEIDDLVHLLPALPYRQALRDAAEATGLLLFQAANCDHQIPAKAYEYLRLGKPIFALTSSTGDTSALLRDAGGATIVDLADAETIYRALPAFLHALKAGSHDLPAQGKVLQYSRRNQAESLATCLSDVLSQWEAGERKVSPAEQGHALF